MVVLLIVIGEEPVNDIVIPFKTAFAVVSFNVPDTLYAPLVVMDDGEIVRLTEVR